MKKEDKKKCGVCKRRKGLSDFHIRCDNGKHRNTCKKCQNKQARENNLRKKK